MEMCKCYSFSAVTDFPFAVLTRCRNAESSCFLISRPRMTGARRLSADALVFLDHQKCTKLGTGKVPCATQGASPHQISVAKRQPWTQRRRQHPHFPGRYSCLSQLIRAKGLRSLHHVFWNCASKSVL